MRTSISLVALAGALALAGCDNAQKASAENATDALQNSASNVVDATGEAISNTAEDIKNAVTATPTGQEFVDKAAKSDAFEIASAKLAKTNAASADVKAFAAMMIEDHTASTAKVKKAAAAASPALTPDPALTSDQQANLDQLTNAKGADFDKLYATQQVGAHESALSLMKTYADKGTVPGLKTIAGEIEPKVQTHLDKIKAIKDKL